MKDPSTKGSSFSFDQKPANPGLVISMDGPGFTGKTHWACTAPDPVALQAIDAGDDGVVQKLQEEGRRIAWSNYPYRDPAFQGLAVNDQQHEQACKAVWERFKKDFYHAIKAGFRTIVWDTATEVWALLRLANFGKLAGVPELQYPKVNAELLGMLKDAREARVVMLLLHHMKEEREQYVEMTSNGPKEKSRPTGRFVRDGMSRIQGQVDVVLRSRYIGPKRNKQGKVVVGEAAEPGKFEIEVWDKCRPNPDAIGMVFENADFPTVASIIVPRIDPSAWESGAVVKAALAADDELVVEV